MRPNKSVVRVGRLGWAAVLLFASATCGYAEEGDKGGLPFVQAGPEAARLDGALGRPTQYIYPVQFIEIDGRTIRPRQVIWVAPGEYTLTVRALIDNPPGLRAGSRLRREDGYNRISVSVEAGKTYSFGMQYKRDEPNNPYQAALYRVDEN